MLQGPIASASPHVRALAEHYAGRAVRRGRRWVVVIGHHEQHRTFRKLEAVDLCALACAPGHALLDYAETSALLADGVPPVRLRPLADPASDCDDGVELAREALLWLAGAGYAGISFSGDRVTGVVGIPNTHA